MKKDALIAALIIGALYIIGKGAYSYMSLWNISDLQRLAGNVGFGKDANVAAAVAMAESSGDPGAIGDVNIPVVGARSYGLWQINSYYHPEFGPDFQTLLDPATNAAAAYSVYEEAGFSFSPWSTYKSGAYIAYLPGSQNA